MFHCMIDAIFIYTCCDVIGRSLDFFVGIAHRYADTGMTKHTDVIASITESHRFFQLESEMLDELVNAVLLGISFGGDVHKGGMPTKKSRLLPITSQQV